MISRTYKLHLDSNVIRLPDLGDLLGKDVEVIVREVNPLELASNFEVINQLLTNASPDFFRQIEDPVAWQKQIRDEW